MFSQHKVRAAVIIVLILVVSCGKAEPTLTPTPPTALQTHTPESTATNVPPAETSSSAETPASSPTAANVPYEVIRALPYTAAGGAGPKLDVYLPESDSRKLPTLLVLGDAHATDLLRHFAGRGYIVLSVDSQEGTYWQDLGNAFCALAWAHTSADTYGFEAKHVVVLGFSILGNHAAMLGTVSDPAAYTGTCPHTLPQEDRLLAVVSLAGALDLTNQADFAQQVIADALPPYLGVEQSEDPIAWQEASPITWIDGSEPPFLLLHGTADVHVDAHQAESFAAALAEVGVDVQLELLPGVDHEGIVGNQEGFQAVEAFLERLIENAETSVLGGCGGGVIAFTSARDGDNDIYLINADGSAVQRLTTSSGDDYWPTWSPDGKQIAFASDRSGNYDIYVVTVPEGTATVEPELRQLTHDLADDLEPAWSPDGTRIAFMSNRTGDTEIYVMNTAGEAQRQLTDNRTDDWLPAWSPDGSEIVFVSEQGGDSEIWVMNEDGSDPRQLTDNDDADLYPAWSPDGRQISFASDRDGHRELYVMAADGSNARQLTHDGASVWVSAWSPDGTQIAFTSDRDGNRELYVIDADGSNVRRLTDNHVLDGIPAWRPLSELVSGPILGDAWTRPSDGMVMVYVPTGTFRMGSSAAQIDTATSLCQQYPDEGCLDRQAWFQYESPQHTITLDSFWIDQTEVTQAQYALCVATGNCPESRLANDPSYNQDDYPAAGIPWQDAASYCAWAGGRLPTEAEWEYAARGEQGHDYPWGNEFDCAGGNFWDDYTGCDDGYPGPAPVGSFPAGTSWCGAQDMAGNTWEWVADAYGEYSVQDQANPTGPASGDQRVLRGGSWGYGPAFVRTASRYAVPPSADYLAVGFRCVVPGGHSRVLDPSGQTIGVPPGGPATIDGTFSPGEWDGALAVTLTHGGELLLMHAEDYLYLGIHSGRMGYGSICVAQDDQIWVLHASAALGKAVYQWEDGSWQQTRQFSWCCRSTDDSAERDALLERDGWMASIGYMGNSHEMEYQIAMNEGRLTVAVVYQQSSTLASALWWPEHLDDDCLGLVLIADLPPETLAFSPETWVTLIAWPE